MADAQTCGQGLAQIAVIPAKMAEMVEALALVLQTHLSTIDTRNEAGRQEHEAYITLTRRYGDIARDLAATAAYMASCRELPVSQHLEEAFADPRLLSSFENYVTREGELLDLLSARVTVDRNMLKEWNRSV